MKNIIFAFQEDIPKYKQIYERFKTHIEQGDITTDERLPSIRQLAYSLQVSRNTTLMAYEQLVAEGYVRGEGRKGFFVNPLEPLLFQSPPPLPSAQRTGAETRVRINFRVAAADHTQFPLKVWRRISNQTLTNQESFQYGEPFGELRLREQIAAYLLQSRGVQADAQAIIIGSSTQQMLIQLGHLLKDEFSSVLVEDPGYDGAREAFQFHQFTLEPLPVYETGVDFSPLANTSSRLIYVTPSHHSPYGVTMSIQQRQSLIHWANEIQGYIIEDDYDSEFRYTQQPFPALASIDSTRVVYLGNFSKSFLPGIRLSYMVLPPSLLHRYQRRFRHFESTTSLLSQLTMARFMEEGEWSRHIKRMRLVYKRKMHHLVSLLQKHFGSEISIIGEQSGLYLLVKFHSTHSEQWFIERAAAQGVDVYPTSIYFVRNKPDFPIVKLGFSHLSCEDIQLGVELLKKAWSE